MFLFCWHFCGVQCWFLEYFCEFMFARRWSMLCVIVKSRAMMNYVCVDADGFSAVIAAGPFTTSDNIIYEPLLDLMACLRNDSPPDICILVCAPVFFSSALVQFHACHPDHCSHPRLDRVLLSVTDINAHKQILYLCHCLWFTPKYVMLMLMLMNCFYLRANLVT